MSALDQAPGNGACETAPDLGPFDLTAISSVDRVSSLRTYPAVHRGGRGFSVTLPLPVSANRMYRRGKEGKSTHISKEYAEWKRDALACLRLADVEPLSSTKWAFLVLISEKEAKDADNCIKPVGDLFSNNGYASNDVHVRFCAVIRTSRVPAGLCRIYVRAVEFEEREQVVSAFVSIFSQSTPDDAMSRGAAAGGALGGKHSPVRCVDGPA